MAPPPARRARCAGCERPVLACWCSFVRPVQSRHRFVVLQHPKEAREPFGTVRILRRALPGLIVRVGVDFTRDAELDSMLFGAAHLARLLFPGPRATALRREEREEREECHERAGDDPPLTFVLIDGTWTQARSILGANPRLSELPQRRLDAGRPSRYALRAQPAPGCLSTLEAVAEVIAIADGDEGARAALLTPLDAMVGLQLACADAGGSAVLADRALLERTGYLARP